MLHGGMHALKDAVQLLKIVLLCYFQHKVLAMQDQLLFLLLYQSLCSNLASVMIPAHDGGPNLYTHNLLNPRSIGKINSLAALHSSMDSQQQALLTFTQVKQLHYCFYDSWMDPSDRLDNPPRVVVLHNTISSAYKVEKAKSLLPALHSRSLADQQRSMRGTILTSAIIKRLAR